MQVQSSTPNVAAQHTSHAPEQPKEGSKEGVNITEQPAIQSQVNSKAAGNTGQPDSPKAPNTDLKNRVKVQKS